MIRKAYKIIMRAYLNSWLKDRSKFKLHHCINLCSLSDGHQRPLAETEERGSKFAQQLSNARIWTSRTLEAISFSAS